MHKQARIVLFLICLLFIMSPQHILSQSTEITRIATDLLNPRGIVVLSDNRLLVAQAGTGEISDDGQNSTGKLSILEDLNHDGDFEDSGEIVDSISNLPSYNLMYQFNPGRDEVMGIGDVLMTSDGRIFFTLDANFETLSIVEVSPDFEIIGNLIQRAGSMNSIVYDEQADKIYITESTLNAVSSVSLDGDFAPILYFDLLANNQQAVPAGITLDMLTGDLLVALFSGQLWDYYGETLSFMPGDSKVVRINPQTGEYVDEITGLTTAVDVAVDEAGNLFVVELTTQWPTPVITRELELYDSSSPPDPGGYARFTGRITMYTANSKTPIILADNLDQPTNITYHQGYLYVSVGLGTPNRSVWTSNGLANITGEIYKIKVPD